MQLNTECVHLLRENFTPGLISSGGGGAESGRGIILTGFSSTLLEYRRRGLLKKKVMGLVFLYF